MIFWTHEPQEKNPTNQGRIWRGTTLIAEVKHMESLPLILAAPDLLFALNYLEVELCSPSSKEYHLDVWRNARATINRAHGVL